MSERPELSEKSKYYISKERYYELKHFCLQYPEWEKKVAAISLLKATRTDGSGIKTDFKKPVEIIVEQKLVFEDRMKLVANCAKAADPFLWAYIFRGVTEGKSYDMIRVKTYIPCCKEEYYRAYRKFFYILDKERR